MALIIGIETATKNCSVALFKNGIVIAEKEHITDSYTHSEQLTVFIQCVMESANISLNKVEAVALSMGPGSYTGLRIGTSTAKGLCYALDVPLIAISTLKAMAFSMSKNKCSAIYCPMIDARRMEVFSALFDINNKQIRGVQADVVDVNTYKEFLVNEIIFFGDGSFKCKEIINHKNAKFVDGIYPSAKNLGFLAKNKFKNNDFEDVAYFEPYYLKDFVAGRKKP